MQKKSWILIISYCTCLPFLLRSTTAEGQVNFSITSANITSSSLTVDNATTTFSNTLSLLGGITLATSTATLTRTGGGAGVNPNLFTAQLTKDGSTVYSTTPVISLSSSAQSIFTSLLGLLSSGALTLHYTIPNLSSTAWVAGSYTTNLNFATSGISLASLNPASAPLNLSVSAFIAAPALGSLQLNVNSFNYFRTQTISTTQSINTTATVPVGISVATSGATFSYSGGYSGSTDPLSSTTLTAQLTSPIVGTAISTSTTASNLTASGGFTVPIGNQQASTITYSISPASLKARFLQQGTYTTALNYAAFDIGTPAQASTLNLTTPLTIVVSDMSQLLVNQTDVNLNYTTAADYTNGVFTDVTGHLTISNTTPCDIYVTANSATLANGSNTLPIGIVSISPPPASSGSFSTVNLSTTAQKIISASAPGVDKSLDVRYSIPASKTSQILGKPAGTYTAVITYSLIAL